VLKLLFIGDIVGKPGRDFITEKIKGLRDSLGLDFVVADAENVAAGAGITGSLAQTLLDNGIDGITLGDHVWDQRGWESEIGEFDQVCRPANLPGSCPGRDFIIVETNGFKIGVFTVLGRTYLGMKAECPFLASDRMIEKLKPLCDAVLVEIHAEATSEKQALGWYLDGRVIGVVGTHTHVPTADATVLPNGTAFICDVGMSGPYASVLGREVKPVIQRFLDGMPRRFEVAEGDVRISAVVIEIDPAAAKATNIELITIRKDLS
jgi:metallophosphoesterase (TIGR00282 family)